MEEKEKPKTEGEQVTPKETGEKKSSSSSKKSSDTKGLTAVIRISGMVKVKGDIANTLDRLRLRRKYVCVLVDTSNKNIKGMLEKVKHYVAYGEITKEVLVKLLKERGQTVDKKEIDADKVANEVLSGKKLSDLGLKPFFRLHPPRKGIRSKLQYPKGVLGNNKDDINKLIKRML